MNPSVLFCFDDSTRKPLGRGTNIFMSSAGRRCRAAQIQGGELEQHSEAQLVVLAALPCRGGEEFCPAPPLIGRILTLQPPKSPAQCGSSDFGERTRPRARGSAPTLNPLPDVSDEGVADHTRGRVCSPKILPMAAVSRCATHDWFARNALECSREHMHNQANVQVNRQSLRSGPECRGFASLPFSGGKNPPWKNRRSLNLDRITCLILSMP